MVELLLTSRLENCQNNKPKLLLNDWQTRYTLTTLVFRDFQGITLILAFQGLGVGKFINISIDLCSAEIRVYLFITLLHLSVTRGIHQYYLHVSGLCCFDCSIHQTLSTGHSVKEELSGRQTRIEAVGHKTFSSRQLEEKLSSNH